MSHLTSDAESEADVRTRVRAVLEDRLKIEGLDELPSGYAFRLVSSQLGVLAHEHAPGQVFVRLQGWVASEVPITPELCRYIAIHGGDWLYGHLNVLPREDGTGTVLLRHEFAAQHMTDDQLEEAVRKLGGTLEQLDDQITAEFGGHKRYEDF